MKEIRILTKIIIIETEIINEIEAKKRIINNMMKSIMKSYFLLKILKKNIMIKCMKNKIQNIKLINIRIDKMKNIMVINQKIKIMKINAKN